MKHAATTVLIALLFLSAGATLAQTEAEDAALDTFVAQLKGDLTRKRDSALKYMIELDDAQSKIFWGIVRDYDKESKKTRKERMSLLHDFIRVSNSLTAETASALADRSFSIAEMRTTRHRKYFERVKEEVSPVVAVQFIQLQSQFETMADAKLAASMPLAGK